MTGVTAADFQKRFRYHHGNLKEVMLQTAFDLLAKEGVEALSLRTLTKTAGVSTAAAYSHFRDKDDLLAAIAETGFQRLALQMAEDAAGNFSVRERIEKLMTSYITFARDNKALFRVMFGNELSDMKKFPTLAMTAGKSYSLISTALSKRAAGGEDARFLTVSVWSLAHGLATLVVDNRIDIAQFGAPSLEEFVKRNVAVFAGQLA